MTQLVLERSFNPNLVLNNREISCLVNHLWDKKDDLSALSSFKESTEFSKCIERFPEWIELISEATEEFLNQLKSKSSKRFITEKRKDNTESNISVDYENIFTMLSESTYKGTKTNSLNSKIGLIIPLGSFILHKLILNNFNFIFGLTSIFNFCFLYLHTFLMLELKKNSFRVRYQDILNHKYFNF